MNSKHKYSLFSVLAFLLLNLTSNVIHAQTTGQLTLSGETSAYYGDKKIYTLQDLSNTYGSVGSEYSNFDWFCDGSFITADPYNKTEVEIQWDSSGQKNITTFYNNYGDLYYAELTVNVDFSPGVPEPPVVLSNDCSQVVLQRNESPISDVIWYWQSSATGTSTANSNSTITLTSGTEYFLRAKKTYGDWSPTSSSLQYSIHPDAPTVGTITHPTTTVTTGSVVLSNLPSDGWFISPGNVSGYGSTTTVTGLVASTTYNFTVTNGSGCTSSASANVVINGSPSGQLSTPTIGNVIQPTCATNSASFVITNYNPAYNYTVVPSVGVSVTGATVTVQHVEGTYYSGTNYTIKASNGTSESYPSVPISINTQIYTPSAPIVGVITQPTATSTGSVVLSNLPPYDSWIINPGNISGGYGTSTITITGLAASAQPYNFTVTNSSGCTSSPSANVVINGYCGISEENYVHTITPTIPTTNVATLSNSQKIEEITYYDGIGRPLQKIGIRAGEVINDITGTMVLNDIINPIEYDEFGRQTKEYLPYSDTFNCGVFRGTTLMNSIVTGFYNTNKYENTTNPYLEKKFEASPLNRMLKQAAPGTDWKLGNGHEIKMDYQTNAANEVKNYEVIFANDIYNPTLILSTVNGGYYNSKELYKTVTYDENSLANPTDETAGSTIEFKNKQGQVVLKRTYGTVGTGTTNEKHDTYYVYDDLGNLSFVLPPKAVDLIGSGTSTSQQTSLSFSSVVSSGNTLNLTASNTITLSNGFHAQAGSTFSAVITASGSQNSLDDLCYQYKYDNRNRLVEKKLPGKQWEFIVYDKLDRVVATGPALSPFNDTAAGVVGWMITKYDVFNRPVYTGWEQSSTITSAGRSGKQTAQNSAAVFNESKQASGTINGITAYYSNDIAPTSFELLTVNYYDNYVFPGVASIPTTVETQNVLTTAAEVKGLATGSWIRVPTAISGTQAEIATTFYDKKARPIRTYSTNFLGGYTYTDSKLDFIGKPEYTITYHKRLSGDAELKTKDAFTYSPQGRLLTQTHQINDGSIETIASNSYDELGQLITKEIGGNTQKVNYTYNIRGWLKGINEIAALQQGTDPKDLFAFKINYNTILSGISGLNALYNGNIAETQWATNSDNGTLRSYGYKYDNLNRLRAGIYNKGGVLNRYDESMDYDKNGNIMHLTRYGSLDDNNQTLIDDLTYNYVNNNTTNQLLSVDDIVSNNSNFINEFKNTAGNDYSYDANGNMLRDSNKGITTDIVYNHLNLPTQITFGTTDNIVYIYNAAGQKIQKVVTQGSTTTTTDYLEGYQYNNTTLKFFPTAEGYVEPNGSSYKYVYQYKDHLGNVRLSYDKSLAIQEENNYYPFGLKQTGYNGGTLSTNDALKFKYNGKELQDELGLNMYDYHARNYDPALGRWMNVDPLAEKYPNESPYIYCGNNPIIFVDPDGRDRIYSASGRFIKDTGNGNKLLVRIGNNDVSLSKLNYNKKGTAYAVSRVIANEAKAIGYKGYYGVKKIKNDDTVAHTNSQNTVFFNTTQLKNGSGDNFYDMRSTLRHEADPVVGHKGPDANTFGGHAMVYMNQTKGDEFYKSSPENQSSAIAGFMFRAIKAQAEGDSVLGGMVNDFNKFHEGNYSINYNFQGQNYSSFTVNDIKNNTSFSKNSEEIYKEIQNLKPNE